ncbi:MAG TPA: hypothetical protein VFB82_17055 [Blastocatellia bacterium]|nr:hypothetical protein [Blastocatellia bacterium]
MLGKGISLKDTRAFVIRGLILAAIVIVAASSVHTRPSDARNLFSETRRSSGGSLFDCGYDPAGASDGWSSHRLNKLRVARDSQVRLFSKNANVIAGRATRDISGLATIEDDGNLIIPAAKFNLKNQSVLLTPQDDGYFISRGEIEFNNDFGSAVGLFLGADGNPVSDADNGYRDVFLSGARFPFFGSYYETAYVGTNGYITFTQGDTSARISPAVLASEIPRIAPLWADLDVTTSGNIYYKRFADHHLFTWNRAGQPLYDGASSFQAVLYDDGRIAFVYKKVKAHAAMIGISPGRWENDPRPILFSEPPDEKITGPFFETFAKDRRLDLPAVLREFYRTHSDSFDTAYIWTDFPYDNGLGVAHSFNIRNDIGGIGLQIADRGSAYGSPSRLSTIITMGNEADWPADPDNHAVGLNSAITIVCHEQGHRWLSYVRFAARNEVRNDLLGRENAHWSFLVDSRTSTEGGYSSLMEGNSWRGSAGSTFTTIESAVNYFSPLDQYLMGLRSADEVGDISYLETNAPLQELLREKSPVSGFSLTAARKTISLDQIVAYEGPRTPDASTAPKTFRIAFIMLTENGKPPSPSTLEKISRYRDRLVSYFSAATGRRGSLDASLDQ